MMTEKKVHFKIAKNENFFPYNKIIKKVLFFGMIHGTHTHTRTHTVHALIKIYIKSLLSVHFVVPMTSTGLTLSLLWHCAQPWCSIRANRTGIMVKKSDKQTSCAPELPMLLWTFGSNTAGSSEETEGRESQY